jgi:hypothetical protein
MEKHDTRSSKNAPSFTPRTPLAKHLWELRQEVSPGHTPKVGERG